MALIRDTYFAVILYTCCRTSGCTCYLYSFSGYRAKKYMFICRQNWNTQQCVHLSDHMFTPASTTLDLRYLFNEPLTSTVLFAGMAEHS